MEVLLECCFTSTETVGLLGTGAQDGHLHFELGVGVGGGGLYTYRYTVTIRMTPALRWVAIRAV